MTRAAQLPQPFPLRAAIFDLDGTLADTAGLWREVDITFLSRRGIPYTEDYPQALSTLGFVKGARYTIERYGLDETADEVCAEWTELCAELYRNEVVLRPGAQTYIHALRKAGIPCALATTNEPTVVESMRHVSVAELFDARVYAQEVGHGKDNPHIYIEAARRLGVAPGDCLVFEDIVPAVLSAQAAGMLVCGVQANDSSQPVEELKKAANYWLDDWREVCS